MQKKEQSPQSKGCGLLSLLFLALGGLQAWWFGGLLEIGPKIFLSVLGGLFFSLGLRRVFLLFRKEAFSWLGCISGIIFLGLGFLTLIPAYPQPILQAFPFSKTVSSQRVKLLQKALYEKNENLANRLALLGIGNPEPLDSFGDPLIDQIKNPMLLDRLLSSGLNPDVRDEHGRTPLMNTGEVDLARTLVLHGADVNAQDENGLTALMLSNGGSQDYIRLLLDSGADLYKMDFYERTVIDFMTNPESLAILRSYTDGRDLPTPRDEKQLVGLTSWLESTSLDIDSKDFPSAISVKPDPMAYGGVGNVQIRLVNSNDTDKTFSVDARLNPVALFISASDQGRIVNPKEPQMNQTIRWPLLSLPAHSSGILKMNVIARDFGGDLSIDVQATELGQNANEPINLNLYQALSQHSSSGTPILSIVFIFFAPLTFVIWFLLRQFLGNTHIVTMVSGRICSGAFGLLLVLIVTFALWDTIRLFSSYKKTTGQILDRRYYQETSQSHSSSASNRTTTTVFNVPVACVTYATEGGTVVSTGFSNDSGSVSEFEAFPLGEAVSVWYNPKHPERFVIFRRVGLVFTAIMIILAGIGWLLIQMAILGNRSTIGKIISKFQS